MSQGSDVLFINISPPRNKTPVTDIFTKIFLFHIPAYFFHAHNISKDETSASKNTKVKYSTSSLVGDWKSSNCAYRFFFLKIFIKHSL